LMKPLSDIVMEVTGRPFRRNEYMPLGRAVAVEYRRRHSDTPIPKCERMVDGTTRMVNTYGSDDREWIVDVVRDYYSLSE